MLFAFSCFASLHPLASLSPSLCLSVCLSVSVSACQSVCASVCRSPALYEVTGFRVLAQVQAKPMLDQNMLLSTGDQYNCSLHSLVTPSTVEIQGYVQISRGTWESRCTNDLTPSSQINSSPAIFQPKSRRCGHARLIGDLWALAASDISRYWAT